jgi:hypothetical protein
MMPAVPGYRFCDATVAVACDSPTVAEWLDEFVRPAFAPHTGPADFAVRVRTDSTAHAELAATRPSGTICATPCFALDRLVVAHPGWTAGGRTVLADAKYGALYALDATSAEVCAEPAASLFRGGVMRVVREVLTTRALVSPDRVQLHAAACDVDGRVVAIAGSKAAGKTTLLAYLAAATGARIVANDRAVAERGGDRIVVRGVPTMVSVRPESRALVPRLFRGMTHERPAHLTAAELAAATRDGEPPLVTTRLRLSPPQLARQLGVTLTAEGPLAALVFPEPAELPDAVAIERLPPDDALRRLRASRFGVSSDKADATVFERLLAAHRPADADAALIEAIVARVPCFAIRLGARQFGEPHAARSILRTVLARSDVP